MKAGIQGRLFALLVVGAAHLACGWRHVKKQLENEQPRQPPPAAAQVSSQQEVHNQVKTQAESRSSSTIGPLYRYQRRKCDCLAEGNHFYTTNASAIGVVTPGLCREIPPNQGYCFEGIEASIHTSWVKGTSALFRYYNGKNHFYTIQGGLPAGYRPAGIAGYVFPARAPGTIPLFRYYRPVNHFYTTDPNEIGTTINGTIGHGGYRSEGTECYVYPKCHVTAVRGSWKEWMTIATPMTYTMSWGTNYRNETSKTREWSYSVTTSVSSGFEIGGFSSSFSVDETIGRSVAMSNSESWETSENQTVSFAFEAADVGKTAWQFVFETADTCGNRELPKTKQVALTEGAFREPCCVPGWSDDAPDYTKCHNEASKISNHPRCSVR